ncbi:MAG TPA: MaoC/PaaZ C-terminal domain-containing protein [Myxococcaceae bacterium]|nr:MaoC/PaaZ C-terminal domain-containing protein [Myxococcaceae bacterium]
MSEAKQGSRGRNDLIDADLAFGAALPTTTTHYDHRDVALYALAVGAAKDPLHAGELSLVYEGSEDGMRVLPTFGAMPAVGSFMKMLADGVEIPGMKAPLASVLHGEQRTEILAPLPASATLEHRARVLDVQDRGRHAVVVYEFVSHDAQSGKALLRNEVSTLVRGAGGFAGEKAQVAEPPAPPDRPADAVVEEATLPNQALLFRLCGDWNPLHADPAFAAHAGFPRPILHGLCTFGFAGRHVVNAMAGGDPTRVRSLSGRFSDVVFPGETLVTELWKEGSRVWLKTSTKERGKVAFSHGLVDLAD